MSEIKVFGINHIRENTHIKFTDFGMSISVGLNIEEKISKILRFNQIITGFTGKVYKGEKMFVYRHYKNIQSQFINIKTIQYIQNELLKKVQIDINKAKSIYYGELSNKIRRS